MCSLNKALFWNIFEKVSKKLSKFNYELLLSLNIDLIQKFIEIIVVFKRAIYCLFCLFSAWAYHKLQGKREKETQREEDERGGGVRAPLFLSELLLRNFACRVTVQASGGETSLTACTARHTH